MVNVTLFERTLTRTLTWRVNFSRKSRVAKMSRRCKSSVTPKRANNLHLYGVYRLWFNTLQDLLLGIYLHQVIKHQHKVRTMRGKDPFRVAFFLRRNVLKNGESPVFMRITVNGQRAFSTYTPEAGWRTCHICRRYIPGRQQGLGTVYRADRDRWEGRRGFSRIWKPDSNNAIVGIRHRVQALSSVENL